MIRCQAKGMKKDEDAFRLSRENLAWFRDNYTKIKRKYDNQWVVIQKKGVVANSSNYEQVIECLAKEDRKSAIVEFIDSHQIAMFF